MPLPGVFMSSMRLSVLSLLIFALAGATPKQEAPAPARITEVLLYLRPERAAESFTRESPREFARYIPQLGQVITDVLAKANRPDAKGIFIGVGLKSKTETRFWCEAMDGTIAPELLHELEEKLAKVEGVEIKKGIVAFGMSVSLYGQKPTAQPYPLRWAKATEDAGMQVPAPLEKLFKVIWPEATAEAKE